MAPAKAAVRKFGIFGFDSSVSRISRYAVIIVSCKPELTRSIASAPRAVSDFFVGQLFAGQVFHRADEISVRRLLETLAHSPEADVREVFQPLEIRNRDAPAFR